MNSNASTKILVLISLVFTGFFHATAQNLNSDKQSLSNYTATSISFPFMRIIPDARSASMGEAGVARYPDVNSLTINPSAIVFLPHQAGFGVSHSPWLNRVVKDMSLSYFSAYFNSGQQALGLSLRYFSVGEMTLRNEEAQLVGLAHPTEYAFDFTYSRKLSPYFSLGATIRYVQSRLAVDEQATAMQATAAAVAADVSAYLRKPAHIFGHRATMAAGLNISNIGRSIGNQTAEKSYLPTNLRIGTSASVEVDDFSQLSLAADLNKLLVPKIKHSIWSSSFGLDYTFKQQFSMRAGYLYAPAKSGYGSYPTLGAGFQHQSMQLDLAYLPVTLEKSPMANTLKISLMFNFGTLAQSRYGYIRPF